MVRAPCWSATAREFPCTHEHVSGGRVNVGDARRRHRRRTRRRAHDLWRAGGVPRASGAGGMGEIVQYAADATILGWGLDEAALALAAQLARW